MAYFLFDLDGPLLDVSEKYYRVYADILQQHDYPPLSKEVYWERKRSRSNEIETLKFSGADALFTKYQSTRKALIETDHYLQFDILQPGAINCLRQVSKKYTLILVTLRSSKAQLISQLQSMSLTGHFKSILNAPHSQDRAPWEIKVNLIQSILPDTDFADGFFIGDTETDIQAAKSIGAQSIAVMNGIRSREMLEHYTPEHLITGIDALTEVTSLNLTNS